MVPKIMRAIVVKTSSGNPSVFFYKPTDDQALISSIDQPQNFIGTRYHTVSTLELFVAFELLKNHMNTHPDRLFIVCIALVNGDIRASLFNIQDLKKVSENRCRAVYCSKNPSSILLFDSPDERERIVQKALSL
jgi:hypothetical protein